MIPAKKAVTGATFAIRVHPNARNSAITGRVGDVLKVSLKAPAVEGRANQACIEFLAELLDVPRLCITIAGGKTSRNKVIRVAGLSSEELQKRLIAPISSRNPAK